MERDGLVTRHKGTGRSKVEVSLTEKGLDVFNQSFYSETDKKIFSALTKKQRERLSQYLWKLRVRTLEHLGIPEWHFSFITQPYRDRRVSRHTEELKRTRWPDWKRG